MKIKAILYMFLTALFLTTPVLAQDSSSSIFEELDESEIVGSELEFPLTMIMDTETVGVNISTEDGVEQILIVTEDGVVQHFETGAYPGEPTMLITTSEEVLEDIAQTPEEERTQALLDAINNDDIKIEKTSGWNNFWYGITEWIGITIAGWFV